MKLFFLTLLICISLSFQSFGRQVMSWIPVYGIGSVKSMMNDATKSEWLKNGVTHIGLQFWVPGDNGKVVFATDYQFQWKAATISQDVQDFVAWGNANNIKIMMCFHNIRENDFDWTYAQQVINDYPYQTVDSIMDIMNYYNLDGVDIDFEGIGDYNSDKNAFVSFLDTLGRALHQSNRELSVDMFSTPCYNTPNPSWESAMAPHVDFMNIMGYNDTYEDNNTLFSWCPMTPSAANSYAFKYSYIESYLTVTQGVVSSKLSYGIPAWVDTWGGQCLQEHILDIIDVSDAGGIAIWDLTLGGGGYWTNPTTWDLIKMFKYDSTSAQIREHLSICTPVTSTVPIQGSASPIFFDSYNQILNLSGMAGDLYLYSPSGVLEKTWHVNAGENISFTGISNGFYIVKFKTEVNVFSEKIILSE